MARPDDARPPRALGLVSAADASAVRGYARAAADLLARGPLTLADRDRLLARGQRLGLGRFDANLVLAAVEHQCRASPPALRIGPAADPGPRPPVCPKWAAATAAVALQAAIASGAWWLLA